VSSINLQSLRNTTFSVLDETNCSFGIPRVAVVEVSPNTLDIAVVDVLDQVDQVLLAITSCEMVVSLSLPDSQ
jgi:hypothetical protein